MLSPRVMLELTSSDPGSPASDSRIETPLVERILLGEDAFLAGLRWRAGAAPVVTENLSGVTRYPQVLLERAVDQSSLFGVGTVTVCLVDDGERFNAAASDGQPSA